jgi:peptidoglycan/xylan/chitin deacetylase (PgdA/CDA1 family)
MKFQLHLKNGILSLDKLLARLCIPMTNEKGTLLSFLFHGLFQNREEMTTGMVDPQQGVTVEMFRRFIGYFQDHSYRFVSPKEIIEGLSPQGKYVLLTFDDGYYNNTRALPVLEKLGVPAVFFISSDHVRRGKGFWWDVAYREFKKRGNTCDEILRANVGYKWLKTAEVESRLQKEFGQSVLNPISDLDRPFTAAELKDFAAHPLVSLGNHTKDHAILTNYSDSEIQEQIRGCQVTIREITGKTPQIIAYPNGNESPEIRKAAQECGLQLGILAHPGKNRLPVKAGSLEALTLKRFTLWGNRGIDVQCRISRSSVSLYKFVKDVELRVDTRLASLRPA